jgi:hypothetical protein
VNDYHIEHHTPGRTLPSLPRSRPAVAPLGAAAVLFAARMLGEPLGLALPGVQEVLDATGATRSRAYELAGEVLDFLPTLERPRGRPLAAREPEPERELGPRSTIPAEVLRFVMRHPGCVHGRGQRKRYGDRFRRFVVELRARHADVPLEDFSSLAHVPLGTLKSWLSTTPAELSSNAPESYDEQSLATTDADTESRAPSVTAARVAVVLTAYEGWHGGFRDFCDHVQRELHVAWGRDTIAQVLELHGVRLARRRPGRSPDELALRGAFQTFFPGAQWVGDGMTVSVGVGGGEQVVLNFELQCDAFTGAFVGISIRDTEDSAAVIESFEHGIATTGAAPLAELLDNKPSNHTEEVDGTLGDTIRLRSTPERPQNKAHVEGAFGLFATTAPPIELDLRATARDVAAQVLGLVTTTWARASNHRPRSDRGDRSRAQLYALEPTADQIAEAQRAFEERRRRQDLARRTLEARQRPDVAVFLDDAFGRLGLLDPERHVRLAISRYRFDAIVAGVAIFETKLGRGTLPDGVDARYLLGIVRNLDEEQEGRLIAETLLRLRRQARDITLARLERERAELCDRGSAHEILAALIDHALLDESALDRAFWLDAVGDFVTAPMATGDRDDRYQAATRCIHATFRSPPRRRHEAVRGLAARLVPLA